jgi:hypothetical protein
MIPEESPVIWIDFRHIQEAIWAARTLEPQLSLQTSQSSPSKYDDLKEHTRLIISSLRDFPRYRSHDSLETILGGLMRRVYQKADGMMKREKISTVFINWIANYCDRNVTGVELGFLGRNFSDHRLAEERNTIILREKVISEM